MTCIEKYNEQKNTTTKIIRNLNRARGLTAIGKEAPHNDKHLIGFMITAFGVGISLCGFMHHMGIMAILTDIVLVVQRYRSIF